MIRSFSTKEEIYNKYNPIFINKKEEKQAMKVKEISTFIKSTVVAFVISLAVIPAVYTYATPTPPPPPTPTTITVHAGESIQTAIDTANAGDTIKVEPGTYTESLNINKSDITIESTESHNAEILLDASSKSILFAADNITLKGFKITKNYIQSMIELRGTSGAKIIENQLVGDGTALSRARGIDLGYGGDSAANVTIQGNEFKDLHCGLYIFRGETVNINNANRFENMIEGAVSIETYAAGINISGNSAANANALVYFWNNFYAAGLDFDEEVTISDDNTLENTKKLIRYYAVHNTSKDKYYLTIQAAVTDAAAGNTIEVPEGTYTENVTVNKSLTLNSENAEVRGKMTITAGDVTVDGFSFNSSVAGAIVSVYGNITNVSVTDCTFKGNNLPMGIALEGGTPDRVSISGCTFEGLHAGVYISRGKNVTISSNRFTTMVEGAISIETYAEAVSITGNTATNARALVYFWNNYYDPTLVFDEQVTIAGDNVLNNTLRLTRSYNIQNAGTGEFYETLQAAINDAGTSDTIKVYPGVYNTGISITNVNPVTGGAGGNSFIVFVNKEGLTIEGVDEDGNPITNYNDVMTNIIATAAAPTFGSSTIFVQADNVTITGLGITAHEPSANKTIEVVGDNVKIANCKINAFGVGAIYLDDNRFDAASSTSHLQSYLIEGNYMNGSIAITSGAGHSGPVENRIIRNNLIKDLALSQYDMYGIGFRGSNSNVAWYVYPVGAAIITGNRFENGKPRGYVMADGEGYADLDWASILQNNTFDKAVVVYDGTTGNIRADSNVASSPNRKRIGTSIKEEVDRASAGDTVVVSSGTYTENISVSLDKAGLVLKGANFGVRAGADQTRSVESVIDGRIEINANNVTVNGFKIINGASSVGVDKSGVYIVASTSGHKISNNIITGTGNAGRGILFGYNLGEILVKGNEINNWNSGIYVNPTNNASNIKFEGNKIHHNTVGIGSDGISGVTVVSNTFSDNTEEALGTSNVGTDVSVTYNSFVNNGAGIKHYFPNWPDVNTGAENVVSAVYNYWGISTDPKNLIAGDISYMPWYVDAQKTVMSNNADLKGLTISAGAISPGFAPDKYAYTITVMGNSKSTVKVTATAVDGNASIKVNSAAAASGVESGDIVLNDGNNDIEIVVVSQDGSVTRKYAIKAFLTAPYSGGGDSYSPSSSAPAALEDNSSIESDNNTVVLSSVIQVGSTGTANLSTTQVNDIISNIENLAKQKQDAANAGKADTEAKVVIAVESTSALTSANVNIPQNIIAAAKNNNIDGIEISTPVASVTFPPQALMLDGAVTVNVETAITDKSKLTEEQQAAAGDSIVYDFNVRVTGNNGTTQVSSFGTNVEVAVPYTLKEGDNPNQITVFYLNDKGQLENMQGVYDPETKTVKFNTDHFSKYIVKANNIVFGDIEKYTWAKDQIESMAAKGIVNGKAQGYFKPAENVTRAEFASLLVRMFRIKEVEDCAACRFSDVKAGAWYEKAVMSAVDAGIVTGYEDGTFKPEDNISRQDMAVMIARALKKYKNAEIPGNIDTYLDFSDKTSFGEYAKESIAAAVKYGIIKGNPDKSYKPANNATRAESAVVIYNVFNLK